MDGGEAHHVAGSREGRKDIRSERVRSHFCAAPSVESNERAGEFKSGTRRGPPDRPPQPPSFVLRLLGEGVWCRNHHRPTSAGHEASFCVEPSPLGRATGNFGALFTWCSGNRSWQNSLVALPISRKVPLPRRGGRGRRPQSSAPVVAGPPKPFHMHHKHIPSRSHAHPPTKHRSLPHSCFHRMLSARLVDHPQS